MIQGLTMHDGLWHTASLRMHQSALRECSELDCRPGQRMSRAREGNEDGEKNKYMRATSNLMPGLSGSARPLQPTGCLEAVKGGLYPHSQEVS